MKYNIGLLTSGFSLEEPVAFANRIHKLIKLGLSGDDEDDMPALEESEAPKEEAKEEEAGEMEEVDKAVVQYNELFVGTSFCKMLDSVRETLCIILLILLIGIISLSVLFHYLEDASGILFSAILFISLYASFFS